MLSEQQEQLECLLTFFMSAELTRVQNHCIVKMCTFNCLWMSSSISALKIFDVQIIYLYNQNDMFR